MKTVDFNIKFREKIEKGTYKVTWNNLPVRIICWDRKGVRTPDATTPLPILALADCGVYDKILRVTEDGTAFDIHLSNRYFPLEFKLQVTYQDLPNKLTRVKYCLAKADVFTDNLMKEYGYTWNNNKSYYYNRIEFINSYSKRYMNQFYRKLKLSDHWEYDDEEDWNLDFKEGDYVECICNDGPWVLTIGDLYKILYVEQSGYITRVTIKDIKDDRTLTIGESDFIDMFKHWSIQDAKDGDVLFTSSTASHEAFVFKGIDENGNAKCYFAYDSEDGFREGTYHFIGRATNCKPATKEWRDLLFQKMKGAGYTFDFEKKELRKIEQKSAESTKEYDFHGIKFIPKFAKGTIIKDKKRGEVSTVMDFSYDTGLYTHTYGQFPITIQDNYEIIDPKQEWNDEKKELKKINDKFDFSRMKAFTPVLARTGDHQTWFPHFFESYHPDNHGGEFYMLDEQHTLARYSQCVPFEGNEKLLKTQDPIPPYYDIRKKK